jgi:Regulator of ribonuclease activity B/Family of unknown function (DUF695)
LSYLFPFFKNFLYKYSIVFFFIVTNTYSQTDWVNYLATKNKGIMSISVDLDFINYKPNYKNLLILATRYTDCLNNGFPKDKGLEKLYTFSDSTAFTIDKLTKNQLVGIITYQCFGIDVFYVKDTIGVRDNLNKMFDDKFKSTNNYIIIKKDKNWSYYFNYLYPDDISDEFFTDQQFLLEMVAQGDDLTGRRKISHWAYFKKDKKRQKFKAMVEQLKFSIDSLNYIKDKKYPYELQFSRKDYIYPETISKLSEMIQVLIYPLNGIYEGWGTDIEIQD